MTHDQWGSWLRNDLARSESYGVGSNFLNYKKIMLKNAFSKSALFNLIKMPYKNLLRVYPYSIFHGLKNHKEIRTAGRRNE